MGVQFMHMVHKGVKWSDAGGRGLVQRAEGTQNITKKK